MKLEKLNYLHKRKEIAEECASRGIHDIFLPDGSKRHIAIANSIMDKATSTLHQHLKEIFTIYRDNLQKEIEEELNNLIEENKEKETPRPSIDVDF